MNPETSEAVVSTWEPGAVGLLVIDMTKAFTERGSAFDRNRRAAGLDTDYYFDRLEQVAVPAIMRVATAVRGSGGPVLWVKPLIVSSQARDWPPGLHAASMAPLVPGTPAWGLTSGLTAERTDYEVPKQCVSSFWCGSADPILRHRGVRHVLVAGCLTNGGMMVNAVDAAVRGYQVTVIEDGCAALDPRSHEDALAAHPIYEVRTSADAVDALSTASQDSRRTEGVTTRAPLKERNRP
ncbi:cysteine hydrolase family protein [Nocardioides sp.]|uniref:cysteine hydrolase family protein n=1 Tax=Nocardioides sp. TaxID=35761 RepID=UPI003D0A9666